MRVIFNTAIVAILLSLPGIYASSAFADEKAHVPGHGSLNDFRQPQAGMSESGISSSDDDPSSNVKKFKDSLNEKPFLKSFPWKLIIFSLFIMILTMPLAWKLFKTTKEEVESMDLIGKSSRPASNKKAKKPS